MLAAGAPALRGALELVKADELAYLILDGKVVASGRCKEKVAAARAGTSTGATPGHHRLPEHLIAAAGLVKGSAC